MLDFKSVEGARHYILRDGSPMQVLGDAEKDAKPPEEGAKLVTPKEFDDAVAKLNAADAEFEKSLPALEKEYRASPAFAEQMKIAGENVAQQLRAAGLKVLEASNRDDRGDGRDEPRDVNDRKNP